MIITTVREQVHAMLRTASLPVNAVMSRSPVTVEPETPLEELVRLFERFDHNAFPVVDAEGQLVGLVSKLDLLRLFRPDAEFRIPGFSQMALYRVRDLMRRGVVSVEPDDLVAAASDLMISTGLRSLPVVERMGGMPVLSGMLSRGDLIRGLRREAGTPAEEPDSIDD
jgi:CBS domain-containing protein